MAQAAALTTVISYSHAVGQACANLHFCLAAQHLCAAKQNSTCIKRVFDSNHASWLQDMQHGNYLLIALWRKFVTAICTTAMGVTAMCRLI